MLDSAVPNHIAIVMDGNSRWAKKSNTSRRLGHTKGAKTAQSITLACKKLGVKWLTLYAFSSENWNRDQEEVNDLMELFKEYLTTNLDEFKSNDIKIKFIGRRQELETSIQELMDKVEKATANNTFTLVLAINYGGRDEIRDAAKAYGKAKTGTFESFLYTAGIPDPDLLIRTSGEHRVSNFLLWQLAYAELYFTDVLWPDFTESNLIEAIEAYAKRERRYGSRKKFS